MFTKWYKKIITCFFDRRCSKIIAYGINKHKAGKTSGIYVSKFSQRLTYTSTVFVDNVQRDHNKWYSKNLFLHIFSLKSKKHTLVLSTYLNFWAENCNLLTWSLYNINEETIWHAISLQLATREPASKLSHLAPFISA